MNFPVSFIKGKLRDYQGEVYLGGGGLTSSGKVRTGSWKAAGRGIKGLQDLCKLSLWSNLAKADIWGQLGSLFGVIDIQVTDEPVFADEITSNRMASAYFQCHIDVGLASEHELYQRCSPMWKSPVAPLSHVLPDRTAVYFC